MTEYPIIDSKLSACAGIYIIHNTLNNKVYIGQSCNIYRRCNEHKARLNFNKHKNNHLQRAYLKQGKDVFKFLHIESSLMTGVQLKEHLNEREDYWIAYYKSLDPEFGYNFIDNVTSINLKRTPATGKRRGFQNKERVYSHTIVSKLSCEKEKEILWALIESYLQKDYRVKVKTCGRKANFFTIVFEKNAETIKYSTCKETLLPILIVDGEGNRKKKVAVYEIQPGGSEIIHKEKSIGDMVKYLNITNPPELHACIEKNRNCASNNAATCRGRIFVSEDSYNSEIIYMKRWEYNKQVKASKPKRAKPNVIVQKDLQGNIVRKYERIGLVCEENPSFIKKSLEKVMNLPTRTYKGFTFEYESRPGGIFSHS